MGCGRDISPRPPIAASLCPKQLNNHVIDPCSRHGAITTVPRGAVVERPVCFNLAAFPISLSPVTADH